MIGADLAFVFCAEEAAIPIKSYSPELMVAPVYSSVHPTHGGAIYLKFTSASDAVHD
jgi:NAD(P)H-hydrate repair Nnr-like enzyme with NAD(P)H-hydrate dehydratase domain